MTERPESARSANDQTYVYQGRTSHLGVSSTRNSLTNNARTFICQELPIHVKMWLSCGESESSYCSYQWIDLVFDTCRLRFKEALKV